MSQRERIGFAAVVNLVARERTVAGTLLFHL